MGAVQWEIGKSDDGRTVYRCVVKGYDIPVGGVIDYTPGWPPYKVVMTLPAVEPEWSDTLESAKGRVITIFCKWLMEK